MAWVLAIFAGVYVAVCLILRAMSRQLLYRPWKFLIDPRLCAVDKVDLVDIHPSEDERLYVWHRAPTVPGAPVIVYFDGNRGNISIWNRRWRRIAASGAGFIALSYRGYGGSTRQPTEPGLHEDAALAWSWAIEQYPEKQLALHGFSLGSGIATKLASTLGDVPVILEAPYLSIVESAQRMVPFLPAFLILKDHLRTRDWIGDVTGPLLITHGARDRIVPLRHGKKLFKLAKKPKRLHIFDQANHLTQPAFGLYPEIWKFLNYAPPAPYAEQVYRAEQGLPPTLVDMPDAAPVDTSATAVPTLSRGPRPQRSWAHPSSDHAATANCATKE